MGREVFYQWIPYVFQMSWLLALSVDIFLWIPAYTDIVVVIYFPPVFSSIWFGACCHIWNISVPIWPCSSWLQRIHSDFGDTMAERLGTWSCNRHWSCVHLKWWPIVAHGCPALPPQMVAFHTYNNHMLLSGNSISSTFSPTFKAPLCDKMVLFYGHSMITQKCDITHISLWRHKVVLYDLYPRRIPGDIPSLYIATYLVTCQQ